MLKKSIALVLGIDILICPALSFAGTATIPGMATKIALPSIATNALPQVLTKPDGSQSAVGATVGNPSGNTLTITQSLPQAIIDWKTFNIGSIATVRFNQGGANNVALNRIYDINPSQIYGHLVADGKVYLINRNGILFGAGSQINVHALVASALNIRDEDFKKGLLRFTTDDYTGNGTPLSDDAFVNNLGAITTDNGGLVALVAPQVINGGTILAPAGKIALVGVAQAGSGQTDFELSPDALPGAVDAYYNAAGKPGLASNLEGGQLLSDNGRVELMGSTVTQNGLIRSISSVKSQGVVYLLATDRVITGVKSVTDAGVTDSAEKVSQTYQYDGGAVTVGGINTTTDGNAAAVTTPVPLREIIHNGVIEAPSGTVTLDATERVYLESGSTISVAGVWAEEPASASLVNAQLNSVQLADAQTQKGGVLTGEGITTTQQAGSTIGNITASYTGADQSARERSTQGGQIAIGAASGTLSEFIAKTGANLNFSGGGFHYGDGTAATTKLLSGTTVYDISNAPQDLSYQKVLGVQTVSHSKTGTSDTYYGYYLGGGNALNDYVPAHDAGSNAGSLSINARTTVLDATLDGSATRGAYQTATTSPLTNNGNDYLTSVARGLEEPAYGTLTIGQKETPGIYATTDLGANAIVVKGASDPLPAGFGPGDTLNRQQTELSASVLNSAQLSKLNLFANSSITIEPGALISLKAGGSYSYIDSNGNNSKVYTTALTAKARSIDDRGSIVAPGGSVELTLLDNVTSFASLGKDSEGNAVANPLYVSAASLPSSITMGDGSLISVAGETVDNSKVLAGSAVKNGHIAGGAIIIQDMTVSGTTDGNTVAIAKGATLDVSGGYQFGTDGKLTGGDAGSLTLRGATLDLDGTLRGLALPGKKGGSLTLHAGEVDVVASAGGGDAAPAALPGKLVLTTRELADTGFTQLELDAIHNVEISDGASLSPSTARRPVPTATNSTKGALGNMAVPAGEGETGGGTQSPDYLGGNSVKVVAGLNINTGNLLDPSTSTPIPTDTNARIDIPQNAGISAYANGSLTLAAPYLSMDGVLQAKGGSVSVSASAGDLEIGGSGKILAGGYNKPTSAMVAGQPAGPAPQGGGTVTLTAGSGSITVDAGALVDVSGSQAVQNVSVDANGKPVQVTVAGSAGTLNLNYYNSLSMLGTVDGGARLATAQGGTLAVNSNAGSQNLTAADLSRYQADGFDSLTFKSQSALNLQGAMDLRVARSLTMDSPLINGSGSDDIRLSSAWTTLTNSSATASGGSRQAGGAALSLSGDWLDVTGSTTLSGFSAVNLSAQRDLRLTDLNYKGSNTTPAVDVQGNLNTTGDLTLKAARIYPTTGVQFTINADGKVSTLPGVHPDSTPIYSAGGSVTINAAGGIDHEGYLAAPMGSITLNSPNGRVFLGQDSVLTTSTSAQVYYGNYDGTSWYINHKSDQGTDQVSGAPDKSISLKGSEVVATSGATIDLSGGGSIYSYKYQPDIQGTTDPISVYGKSSLTGQQTRLNRYVILPDNSVQLPGYSYSYTDANGKSRTLTLGAVYLQGVKLADGSYLKAGTYSLLPEQYAFLPGALVITDTGSTVPSGSNLKSSQGYQVVGGYMTFLGTSLSSQVLEGYSIRSASDVLKEGNFLQPAGYTAGNGGELSVNGSKAVVMLGRVNAAALPGSKDARYQGGSMTLVTTDITVQDREPGLAQGFGFDSALPTELANGTQVGAASFSGQGFDSVTLGDNQSTSAVTVKSGAHLGSTDLGNLTLAAAGTVTVQTGGSATGKKVTLSAPAGTIEMQASSLVHAVDSATLDLNDAVLKGALQVDSGTLNLKANQISFVADDFQKTSADIGLFMTESLWSTFKEYKNVGLISRSGIDFERDVNLSVAGALTLDSAALTGQSTVTVGAQDITLQHSVAAAGAQTSNSTTTISASPGGSLTVKGGSIQAHGDLAINGFAKASLESAGDLTLQGAGSLTASGNLNLTAARVTTSYYMDAATPYQVANFQLNAANGAVTVMKTVQADGTVAISGTTHTPGGSLSITAGSITDSGTIEVDSGKLVLNATGVDGIAIGSRTINVGDPQHPAPVVTNGELLAQGTRQVSGDGNSYSYSPGGSVTLASSVGGITVAQGSKIDVSASEQGDAGSVTLSAPKGAVSLNGTLKGGAAHGEGGALSLDAASADLNALSGKVAEFAGKLAVRARTGSLTLDSGNTLAAKEITLEADDAASGRIDVNGKLTTAVQNNKDGGNVALYAQNDLTVAGTIEAASAGTATAPASAGVVSLASQSGTIHLASAAMIDVSDSQGNGGTVNLRAQRSGSSMLLDLNGSVKGASQVVAEAVKVYHATSVTSALIKSINTDSNAYLAKATVSLPAGISAGAFHLRPGVEVQSSGDLSLATAWDLTSARYGANSEPGMLTLRAAGNLNINANLVDHPTAMASLYQSNDSYNNIKQSWGITLAAGADLAAANPLAVNAGSGSGNLTIGSASGSKVASTVYSENGPVRFASANDTVLYPSAATGYMINSSMPYELGSYGGSISGQVGHDLTIKGGAAIQTATGDIEISVGNNLQLKDSTSNLGAIRTTGEYAQGSQVESGPGSGVMRTAKITDYWTYHDGGEITLEVGGNVAGRANKNTSTGANSGSGLANSWDYIYGDLKKGVTPIDAYLSASFQGVNSTQGIATMGGGSIDVQAAGSFNSQVGTFGTRSAGDLNINAGGDLGGRFRVMDGSATLVSGGSFGSSSNPQEIELGKAQFSVASQGDAYVGAILNPDNSRAGKLFVGSTNPRWNLTYGYQDGNGGRDTSVAIASLNGNLTLTGIANYEAYPTDTEGGINYGQRQQILPPSVSLSAKGDIDILNDFYLAPSPTGNLQISAGGSIDGLHDYQFARITMSDKLPATYYGLLLAEPSNMLSDDPTEKSLIHAGDSQPVLVSAGGDLNDLQIVAPKLAQVSAGGDIHNLIYCAENLGAGDVSSIRAGGSITYDILGAADKATGQWSYTLGGAPITNVTTIYGVVEQGGGGSLLIQAGSNPNSGGSINLGTTAGIQSVGSVDSPLLSQLLPGAGSNIVVAVGVKPAANGSQFSAVNAQQFFDGTGGSSGGQSGSIAVNSSNGSSVSSAGNVSSSTSGSAQTADEAKELGLRQEGVTYSNLKSTKPSEAQQVIDAARSGIIEPYFDKADPATGNLNMTQSQISATNGNGSIYIMARSNLNVGSSALSNNSNVGTTGIFTSGGGGVNIFGGGDINVNQSRTMTFMGGDITVWSDYGNINAGRGSKTAVSPGKAIPIHKQMPDGSVGPVIGYSYQPPAVGSGIRGVTSDPVNFPAGDIYLFAPAGDIDAGEAGISGGHVFLGSVTVSNAGNISSVAAGGISGAASSSVSIGSLSGAGSVAENSKMIDQAAGVSTAQDKMAQQVNAVDDFLSNWLDLKIVSFDE